MIAAVRIAPVERWCEHYKPDAPIELLVGRKVELYTASMTEDQTESWRKPCGGKWWRISEKSRQEIEQLICGPCGEFFCEHMLEMD